MSVDIRKFPDIRKFLVKTAVYVVLIAGGFELLYKVGFYPIVTDSTYFDHKMSWVQQHPLKRPEFVAVGSSVPLYGLESERIVRQIPLSYFNFSSWNVKMTECWMIVRLVVHDYHPKYVLVGSNLGDFCGETDHSYLNYTGANPFIRRRLPEMLYLLNFHSIHQIAYRKFNVRKIDFDRWGEGNWAFDRAEIIGPPPVRGKGGLEALPFDAQHEAMHYRALDSMGRWLRDQHIKMIFVQFPILEKNLADDSVRARVMHHIQTCRSIVGSEGGIFLNYYNAIRGNDTLFAGPIHLRPPGARVFTDMLVRDLEPIIRQNK